MKMKKNIKILSTALALSSWWSACKTAEDPQPAAAEATASAANADEEDLGSEDAAIAAADSNMVENSDSVNFAGDTGSDSTAENFTATSANADDGNLFAEELAAESKAEAKKQPAVSTSNQEVNPTTIPETALPPLNPVEQAPALNAADARAPSIAADAAAAEVAASGAPENLTNNVAPVGIGSEMIPPSLSDGGQAAAPVPTPPLSSTPAVAPAAKAPSPAAQDLDATLSLLSWVGYRINETGRELKVELTTQGGPEFEVFEETNRAQQLELVVRFYQTKLRRKLRWSIDSSEFRSPVAYIRMREFHDKGIVDVVLTHRDRVLPRFYTAPGKMLFAYPIPERYFDKSKAVSRRVRDKAESLVASDSLPLFKQVEKDASIRHVGYQRPDIFTKEIEQARPIREFMREQARDKIDPFGLPTSFDRQNTPAKTSPRTGWRWTEASLMAVAQDDLEPEEVTTPEDEEVNNASASNAENASSNQAAEANSANSGQGGEGDQAIPVETVTEEPDTEGLEDAGSLSETNTAIESSNAVPQDNAATNSATNAAGANANAAAAAEPPQKNSASGANADSRSPAPPQNFNAEQPAAEQAPLAAEPTPADVMGQANAGPAPAQYNGKPVFMEFYEAPLSLVLKSFSDETGNNFVFPSSIGQTPVSVHFKGVPWDEALKAILETHELGLVRIGQNVVRVDKIDNLTTYMSALEKAKEHETRRLPTKVLIFRLNNAVAKDVNARVQFLLARDIEIDPRIKSSDDERTNAVVIEAPAHVLAKAKSIIERLDLETPQVEIAARIVEVKKSQNNFLGFSWGNNFNFDPGRALGFGTLNFPNSLGSNFAVDPGVNGTSAAGVGRFRFGSLNKFVDLDLLLKMEEQKGTTNVLQSNRVLVLDGRKANIIAGTSKFFRAAGAVNVPAGGAGGGAVVQDGLREVKFNLELAVTPQVTAMGAVIMDIKIQSDTPGTPGGDSVADKSTREINTQMVRNSGDTGVIGGIYDTSHVTSYTGIPLLSDIPIIGALFRSSKVSDSQTELLIMVTPNIISGLSKEAALADEAEAGARNRQALNRSRVTAPVLQQKKGTAVF